LSSRTPDELYTQAAADFGGPLARLVRAYESDPDLQRDLLQEIHLGLWKSFRSFNGHCSLRTWVYRVAHNTAASHVLRRQRLRLDSMTTIDALADVPDAGGPAEIAESGELLARLMALIHSLRAPDRQLVLLYLEGLDAEAIGEIAGLSAAAVAMKIHRLKANLAKRFHGSNL
jgi:RNA polymerase sigma-70 factor (ECF subfamily)